MSGMDVAEIVETSCVGFKIGPKIKPGDEVTAEFLQGVRDAMRQFQAEVKAGRREPGEFEHQLERQLTVQQMQLVYVELQKDTDLTLTLILTLTLTLIGRTPTCMACCARRISASSEIWRIGNPGAPILSARCLRRGTGTK